MKKVICFLITLFLMIICFSLDSLKTEAVSYDFSDFTFTAQLKITETDKSSCTITWKTDLEIKYLDFYIVLPNNREQNPYQSGRENCAGKFYTKFVDGYYLNTLEFDVYYHQLGNILAKFYYSYDFVIDQNSEDIKEINYVFVTGNWVEKQPIYKAVIIGFVISVFIAISTYVIIENSRHNIIKDNIVKETDNFDEEDENFDPIQNRRRKVEEEDE